MKKLRFLQLSQQAKFYALLFSAYGKLSNNTLKTMAMNLLKNRYLNGTFQSIYTEGALPFNCCEALASPRRCTTVNFYISPSDKGAFIGR